MKLKIDLHLHTEYSPDSIITLDGLLLHARRKKLDAVAITDHDTMEGASRYVEETEFLIVPGVEVSSLRGHIVALGVGDPISKDLTIEETIDRIHRQEESPSLVIQQFYSREASAQERLRVSMQWKC